MTRIGYSDDEDYPGQFALWRGNVARSLAGKKGRAALRDLEAALLALPAKRLIAHYLVRDGDVCATGALVAFRRERKGLTREQALAQMAEETAPACATCWHQKAAHTPTCATCPERRVMLAADAASIGRPYTPQPDCQAYVVADWDDGEDADGLPEQVALIDGVPKLVTWAIVEANDQPEWSTYKTDEERYEALLRWTRELIANPRSFV